MGNVVNGNTLYIYIYLVIFKGQEMSLNSFSLKINDLYRAVGRLNGFARAIIDCELLLLMKLLQLGQVHFSNFL